MDDRGAAHKHRSHRSGGDLLPLLLRLERQVAVLQQENAFLRARLRDAGVDANPLHGQASAANDSTQHRQPHRSRKARVHDKGDTSARSDGSHSFIVAGMGEEDALSGGDLSELEDALSAQGHQQPSSGRRGSTHRFRRFPNAAAKMAMPGRMMSKKLQRAYQASTHRIASTFGRGTGTSGAPQRSLFTGALLNAYQWHSDGVWDLHYLEAPGSVELVVSAGADRCARVHVLQSASCLAHYVGHRGSVNTARLYYIDNEVCCFTGSGDRTMHLWKPPLSTLNQSDGHQPQAALQDVSITEPTAAFRGHAGSVTAVNQFTGRLMLSASADALVKLWDVQTAECVLSLEGHQQGVTDVKSLSAKQLAVSCSKDKTVRLWDCRESSIREVSTCQGHDAAVNSIVVCSEDVIASSSEDSTIKLWDIRKLGTPLHQVRTEAPANRMAIDQVHGQIAAPLDTGLLLLVDAQHGIKTGSLPKRSEQRHGRAAMAVDWISANRLISASFDYTVRTWVVKEAPSTSSAQARLQVERRETVGNEATDDPISAPQITSTPSPGRHHDNAASKRLSTSTSSETNPGNASVSTLSPSKRSSLHSNAADKGVFSI